MKNQTKTQLFWGILVPIICVAIILAVVLPLTLRKKISSQHQVVSKPPPPPSPPGLDIFSFTTITDAPGTVQYIRSQQGVLSVYSVQPLVYLILIPGQKIQTTTNIDQATIITAVMFTNNIPPVDYTTQPMYIMLGRFSSKDIYINRLFNNNLFLNWDATMVVSQGKPGATMLDQTYLISTAGVLTNSLTSKKVTTDIVHMGVITCDSCAQMNVTPF